ncbi:TetR/AcrR family transcriptional regulator [Paracandidimonas lactea]|uniref:TetR/AcrR family transcriptional regulator n=1 Tax=Paracandidimonas lactea TaxID=2895524 RepID=UPI001F0080B9|nr:TetR/AcrR family transcriptional regulator [Paracandidimonas lactea]
MTQHTTHSTRSRILDAAELLFAQHGHDNTSMRQITGAAQVNLSAVNYHFGSKDGLIKAVFQRRVAALNKERLTLLDALEHETGGEPLKPSQIVDAFFGPLIRHAYSGTSDGRAFVPLLERSMSDPGGFIRATLIDEHSSVFIRFKQALLHALPGVPEVEIIWRFHFMLGACSYALAGTEVLQTAIGWQASGAEAGDPIQRLQGRLMSFLLGGLRAPLPGADAAAHPHCQVA